MRPTHSRFLVLAAATMFAAAPLTFAADNSAPNDHQQQAKQAEKEAPTGSQTAKNAQSNNTESSNQAPEGFVMVEEDLVMLTANEPQAHFMQAESDLSNNDHKAAASELRLAAGYMDMQASRGAGNDRQGLTTAADDVRKAADEVAKSSGTDSKLIKQTGKDADFALARYFQAKADSELKDNKAVRAGHDIESSVDALQSGYAWSGEKVPSEAATAIANSQQLATQLIVPMTNEQTNTSGGEAQTASAKTSPKPESSSIEIPKDASKTVASLGSAIEKCCPNDQSSASAR